ncbi:MAG: hypothetical protein IKF45_06750 [Lachnospiraceae bacterium]|nr:hypothetical protein [Lachnospiraceae bacterium]MBQ6363717.1 hypothetical protein [Lachnospiraceae bacterium]MBR2996394.1 hypothetical protein [Lachnospiraceae bacterium]
MGTLKKLFGAACAAAGIVCAAVAAGILVYRITHPVYYDGYDNISEDEKESV